MVHELKALDEEQGQAQQLARERLLHELLELVACEGDKSIPSSPPAPGHSQMIQAAINHMQSHYQEELTRDAMAARAGVNPRFFSRMFKEETGSSFSEYLAGIRISKAKAQLLLSEHNLDEIARDVGYSNGLYLSRKFKQWTGVSPTGYIQQPKRVVIYDWVGNLLALGVQPVGASYFYSLKLLHLLQDELGGVVDVGRSTVDPVVQLEPELIVVPKWLGSTMIGQLEKIAPTLIVPYGDPLERMRQLAQALDKREEAEAFITTYKERAAEVRERLHAYIRPGETVGLYELAPGSIWAFNEYHGRGGYNLYRGLGFTPPPLVQQNVIGKGMIRELTMEQLPAYAADHMIISYPFTAESAAYVNRQMSHAVWQSIPAYRHNRIYFIDKQIFHPNDALSLIKQLPLQERLIASRPQGSPTE